MPITDVRPYNLLLSQYLSACGPGGFGCHTQIKIEFLQDRFHIQPQFCTMLDRPYACAIRGIPVPCPTHRGQNDYEIDALSSEYWAIRSFARTVYEVNASISYSFTLLCNATGRFCPSICQT